VEDAMIAYIGRWVERGGYAGAPVRHMLGLYRGVAGARGWRRVLSDAKALGRVKTLADAQQLFDEARAHLRRGAESDEAAVAA
jgi:tRNA-dihydrouridine synthase A